MRLKERAPASARVWADGHILRRDPDEKGLYRGRVSLSRSRLSTEMLIITIIGRTAASLTFAGLPDLGESKGRQV